MKKKNFLFVEEWIDEFFAKSNILKTKEIKIKGKDVFLNYLNLEKKGFFVKIQLFKLGKKGFL